MKTFLALVTVCYCLLLVRSTQIADCCCDTETVDNINTHFLSAILTSLRQTTFFRIFKVDLFKPCIFWPDNALCYQPSCSIQQCCEEDIPAPWRADTQSKDEVDRLLADPFQTWENDDENQWVEPATIEQEMIYVDLMVNPDGYTGYKGEEAGRVWRSIYQAKNNFNNHNNGDNTLPKPLEDQEMEERVLYRLISGFHTLTTAMVFANYPSPDDPNVFGPNLDLYKRFVHPNQEYIQNLYFDFVFLLRAVNKASSILEAYEYDTGNPEDDNETSKLIHDLLHSDFIQKQCSVKSSFDESIMFKGDRTWMVNDFRKVFLNVSTILDCVGCEKCKLHAKLEFLGLGTALKILFSRDRMTDDLLQRNEIIALIVTLGKYSDAVQFIHSMEQLIAAEEQLQSFDDSQSGSESQSSPNVEKGEL